MSYDAMQFYLKNKDSGKDLSRLLFEAHREIEADYERKRELEAMEERIYQRVMKSLKVQVVDKATPAIKELNKEINKLMNGGK